MQVAASKLLPTTVVGKQPTTHPAGGKTAHHTPSRWENSPPHTQQVGKQPTTHPAGGKTAHHTPSRWENSPPHTQQVRKQPTTHPAGGKTAHHTPSRCENSPPHTQQEEPGSTAFANAVNQLLNTTRTSWPMMCTPKTQMHSNSKTKQTACNTTVSLQQKHSKAASECGGHTSCSIIQYYMYVLLDLHWQECFKLRIIQKRSLWGS